MSERFELEHIAATGEADAILVRGERAPRRPTDGKHRRVVVYCAPDVSIPRLAGILRELADALDAARGTASW